MQNQTCFINFSYPELLSNFVFTGLCTFSFPKCNLAWVEFQFSGMYIVPVKTLGVPPSVFQAKGQSIANCFFGIQAPPCSVFKLPAFL